MGGAALGRMVHPAQSDAERAYRLRCGWRTARLRASSPFLLNYDDTPLGNPRTVGEPSIRQLFPATAADLIAAMGATGVILPANVLAIYLCDTASPLVDSLGLGPNLVAAGGPLTGREGVGLPDATFVSKAVVELLDNAAMCFDDNQVGPFDVPDGEVRSFVAILRLNTNATLAAYDLISLRVGAGLLWQTSALPGSNFYIYGSAAAINCSVAGPWFTGAWHCVVGVLDSRVAGAHNVALRTDLGDAISANFAGTMAGGGRNFRIGQGAVTNAPPLQLAYFAWLSSEVTSAQRAAFWRHAQSAGLGTPNTYARTNPLVVSIAASRVACYGAGQLAVGYDAGLVSAALGNALGTGVVAETGISFLGLGTDNQTAWVGTNATNTPADGPSGMRDSMRVADADVANAGYVTSGSANLAGATNVPFQFAAWRQAVAGGGLNAVFRAYFTGDGGGPEELTWATDAGTVPAAYGRIAGNCTPVGAAHTAVVVRIYPTDAVAGSVGTVDCYVEGGVQNRAVDWLAHRRVAAGAAAATSTPTLTEVNANERYQPVRGRVTIEFAGYDTAVAGTHFFLCCGVYGTPGSLAIYGGGNTLYVDHWDNAGGVVCAIHAHILDANRHVVDVLWDSGAPIAGNNGTDHVVMKEGSTVRVSGAAAAWTPRTAAVTPISTGYEAGFAAAHATIARVEFRSQPGSAQD